MKPRLLDLFCGAGGAAMGYHRAGFEVVGVDIKPQPHYPFRFIQADAMEVMRGMTSVRPDKILAFNFAAIHASPPCQAFTSLQWMHNAKRHDDLLTPTRELLNEIGLPYVIENVVGAPMEAAIRLCGSSFGLGSGDAELRRHRHFEVNPPILLSPPCEHGHRERVIGVYGGHGRDRRRKLNTQDFHVTARREAMGIDWMTDGELSQAIPPAYTEWIGRQLLQVIERRVA
jgi:DNA (cytosine-5)-methyltransferase 1